MFMEEQAWAEAQFAGAELGDARLSKGWCG